MLECVDMHQLMLGPLIPDGLLFGEASEQLGDGAMVADVEQMCEASILVFWSSYLHSHLLLWHSMP